MTKTITPLKKSIRIPFAGFYESLISAVIDNDIEREIEYMNDDASVSLTVADFDIDYRGMHHDLAPQYAANFFAWLENKTGVSIEYEFDSLVSPRFYNFDTDAIYCHINPRDLTPLLNWMDREYPGFFKRYIRERLTPRDGFIPFYSKAVGRWGVIDDWEAPQLALIFDAACAAITEDFLCVLEGSFIDEYFYLGSFSVSNFMKLLERRPHARQF